MKTKIGKLAKIRIENEGLRTGLNLSKSRVSEQRIIIRKLEKELNEQKGYRNREVEQNNSQFAEIQKLKEEKKLLETKLKMTGSLFLDSLKTHVDLLARIENGE